MQSDPFLILLRTCIIPFTAIVVVGCEPTRYPCPFKISEKATKYARYILYPHTILHISEFYNQFV
jgi:hypothetical protein